MHRFAVVAAIVLVGCSAAPPTPTPAGIGNTTPAPGSSASTSVETSPGATPAPTTTSQDLIAAGLAAGTIDTGTALELRAWALFGDPRLPERYDGTGSSGEDQSLFREIEAGLDSLPADKRDELSRYLLRPTDPRSPFSSAPPAARNSAIRLAAFAEEATPSPRECTAPSEWQHDDWSPDGSIDHGFRAWACGASLADVQGDLNTVLGLGAALWPKMTMAEPDGMGPPVPDLGIADNGENGKVDVYVLDSLAECRMRGGKCRAITGDAIAVAREDTPLHCGVSGFPARGCSGYMLLGRARLNDPAFAADFAHEFFHTLQASHNGQSSITWYDEASAVWAAWYYERDSAKEAAYQFFDRYEIDNRSLLWYEYQKPYQYQAWDWPLFQFTTAGAKNVFQTWAAMESATTSDSVDKAIDGELDFATAFRDFAVLNAQPDGYKPSSSTGLEADTWQTKPELADFPREPHIMTSPGGEITLGRTPHDADIQSLAAQYDEYAITDSNIHQVEIDITGLLNADQADLDVLGQLNGAETWHRFRGSGGKLKFCREQADQNVTYMEVVISNHVVARDPQHLDQPDPAKKVTGQYTIEAKDKCEEQDVLLHGTFMGHGEDSLQSSDATFDFDIVWHRPDNPNDPLNFELVSGSFTFDTTVIGVCAGTLGEGGRLETPSTGNTQALSYGDAAQGSRYASVQLSDRRLDNGTISMALAAHFDVPNSSADCQPPFQPFGDIPICPMQFKPMPDGTLQTDSSCADSVGTKWTGHIAGQQ